MDIHLLRCAHGNERIGTHDEVHYTFVTIVWDVSFHVRRKQLHALPLTILNPSHQRIDIMFTKDEICTLVDIIIIDPTHTDPLPWSYTTQGFVAFDAVQVLKKSYHNRHSINQFLPFTIEVFGCLHKQVNVFLHECANVIWSLKGPKDLPRFVLVIFFIKEFQLRCKECKHAPF
jgi:hypothetical protein